MLIVHSSSYQILHISVPDLYKTNCMKQVQTAYFFSLQQLFVFGNCRKHEYARYADNNYLIFFNRDSMYTLCFCIKCTPFDYIWISTHRRQKAPFFYNFCIEGRSVSIWIFFYEMWYFHAVGWVTFK